MSLAVQRLTFREGRDADAILDAFRRTQVYAEASHRERLDLEKYLQDLREGMSLSYRDAVRRVTD